MGCFTKTAVRLIGGASLSVFLHPAMSLAGPGPLPTPTFAPGVCGLGAGSSALLSTGSLRIKLPLAGSQVWRFGPLEPDSTRKILILPSESHFDCTATTFLGASLKICARVDPTTHCHGGANDGLVCPPADCGAGNPCAVNPAQGAVDCAPSGGSLIGYDTLMQVDHDTNMATVGGQPNVAFPLDPQCTATITDPDGSVVHSCIEPEATDAPTPTTGPTTPTPTPKSTPTARAIAAATCTGTSHPHPNVCNGPTETTLTSISEAGGFGLNEAIDLSFEIAADCTTPCPPDDTPLQAGELQISGHITSGQAKGIIWNANNTALIFGTTGSGDGADNCNVLSGADHTCNSTAAGMPIDLTSLGGDCLDSVPTAVNGAVGVLVVPSIDADPTLGDALVTLRLACGTPPPTPTLASTPSPTPTLSSGCAVAPRAGCQLQQRGSGITLKTVSHTARWKWLGGGMPADLAEFGDPVNGSTAYDWCIYDTSASSPSLAFAARVPPHGACGAHPCWQQTHNRFSYTNPAATPNGVTRMTLRPSSGAGAAIVVNGRGANLHLPAPATGSLLLREFPQVIVQLQRSDSAACWEATFTAPPVHDTLRVFVDTVR